MSAVQTPEREQKILENHHRHDLLELLESMSTAFDEHENQNMYSCIAPLLERFWIGYQHDILLKLSDTEIANEWRYALRAHSLPFLKALLSVVCKDYSEARRQLEAFPYHSSWDLEGWRSDYENQLDVYGSLISLIEIEIRFKHTTRILSQFNICDDVQGITLEMLGCVPRAKTTQ